MVSSTAAKRSYERGYAQGREDGRAGVRVPDAGRTFFLYDVGYRDAMKKFGVAIPEPTRAPWPPRDWHLRYEAW